MGADPFFSSDWVIVLYLFHHQNQSVGELVSYRAQSVPGNEEVEWQSVSQGSINLYPLHESSVCLTVYYL